MRALTGLGIVSGWLLVTVAAASDAENCADYPLFNRMGGYEIERCSEVEFDEVEFPVGNADNCVVKQREKVEGKRTDIVYVKEPDAPTKSPLQIARNFQNAVKQAGGRIVKEYGAFNTEQVACDPAEVYGWGDRVMTLQFKDSSKDVWVMVFPFAQGDPHYALRIVEREAMQQELNVSDWMQQLNDTGLLTLYINFDSGKASIKPDSQAIVDKMVALMQQEAQLKLEIAGHTDNVGNAAANQTLSQQRAQALVAALTAKGIDAKRLLAKGYGASKPIADNNSEAGRAKNRRVELIKR